MHNIAKIVKIAQPLYHLAIALAVLILVTSALDLVAPVIFKFVVDEISARIQGTGGDIQKIITLILLAFGINTFATVLTSISNRLGDHFSGRLKKFLTEKFYNKVLTLPQSYFDSEVSGKIVNQLSRGIVSIGDFMNTSTNFILPMFLQSLFTIFVMAYYNIWVGLFTFILFPIYLTLSYFSTVAWGKKEVKKNAIEDYSRGRIQEVISNIKLVKSFMNEKKEYDIISTNLTKSNDIYAEQSSTFHKFDFARNMSLHIIFLIVNLIVFYNTFLGNLSIGTMVLLLSLMAQAQRPLFGMSFILTRIQMAESGSKEYFEILSLPSKEKFREAASNQKIKDPTLAFKNISFKYDESDMVLKNINFDIGTKEKVALVGHSGVGKSTIVNMILKFYEPTKGDILIKNKNYSELSHHQIRDNIALVFQESELFSSTIRENVAYGSDASEKEIINALKLANAYEFVMNLPKGLDSQVGERGVRLSGGQKQRIQIARAILKDSPILILDEATSSLDAKSEKEVQDALENLMKNKLVIIIAHRFSTIQNVNKIIVLDKGKVVDQGNPKELSTRKGIYSDLLNYQIEGNKKLLEQFELY